MLKNISYLLVVLVFFIASCEKPIQDGNNATNTELKKRLGEISLKADSQIKNVYTDFEKKLMAFDKSLNAFLRLDIKPNWNEAIKIPNPSNLHSRNIDSNHLVFIPINAIENSRMHIGFIAAKTNNETTNYITFIDNIEMNGALNNSTLSLDKCITMLMILNQKSYNTNRFRIIDNRILENVFSSQSTNRDVEIKLTSINTQLRETYSIECVTISGPCCGDALDPNCQRICEFVDCDLYTHFLYSDQWLPGPFDSFGGWAGIGSGSIFTIPDGGGGEGGANIPAFFDFAVAPFTWVYIGDDGTSFVDPDETKQPQFQFDQNDNYELLYPRFTNMVKNLKTFVKNNPKVLNALQKYSRMSKQQILDHLTYGLGPKIKVKEMTGRFGYYNKTINNSTLFIRASYVRGLEQAFLQSTQEGTAFLLAVTILHEYVHLGLAQNNISEGKYDFGYGFELDAFNVIVDDDNAGTVVIKFSQYF